MLAYFTVLLLSSLISIESSKVNKHTQCSNPGYQPSTRPPARKHKPVNRYRPVKKPTQPPSDGNYGIPDASFAKDCLKKHNYYRQKRGLQPFTWSAKLAQFAQKWSRQIANARKLFHSSGGFGENLYMTYNGDKSCSAAIDSWYSEHRLYHGQPIGKGNFKEYGHYTQLIWKTTTHVGCAYADTADGKSRYTTCEYYPA